MKSTAAGRTLVEVMIASAIGGLLMTLGYLFLASTPAGGDPMRQAVLQETARRAVETMARELRVADAARLSITPYHGSDRVDFHIPSRFSEDRPSWSGPIQYRYEPSVVDSNANGVADEGRLVRIEGRDVLTLCDRVAADGLRFERSGPRLTIRLRLVSTDGRGRLIESQAETSVTLRNDTRQGRSEGP